jgi:uncharacterized protein YukE
VEDYELADLGGYVVGAAQGAAREVERLAAGVIAPLTARREEISGLSSALVDVNGAVGAKTDLLDQYADNLRKIADTFEQSDGQ